MNSPPPGRDRTPLAYRVLDSWMRCVAFLVPAAARQQWRAEWDGELWYGLAAKQHRARWRLALGLGVGVLWDALHLRRVGAKGQDLPRRSGDKTWASFLADLRLGVRMLRKTPGFTGVVAVTLALGIGGTVTMFSVVNALLLRPLPYPDAGRLVIMWMGRPGASVNKDWFSPAQFADIQAGTDAFETLALAEGSSATMTGRGPAARVGWVRAQSAYLRMLGAQTIAGRVLDAGDDRPSAKPVVLLTYDLWQRAYGGKLDAVGRAITLDGTDYEIVGVLSPDLLLDNEVLPTWGGIGRVDVVLSAPLSEELLGNRENEGYNVVGRLKPGVTLTQAQAELDVVAAGIQERYERDPNSGFFIRAVPLIEEVVGGVRRALVVLLASVGCVLLIACVNVANLLLARAGARRRELGVRATLGAVRGRLVRQLLTESGLLALIGGGLGVGLAAAGLSAVHQFGAASLPRLSEIGIDRRVLGFSLATTAVTCLVFGWLPALRTTRIDLAETLKAGGRGTTRGGALWSRFNLSSGLVVGEIGLALVLLVAGALLTRSFAAVQRVDPGFDAKGRLTFRVRLSGDHYRERSARVAFYDRLTERLRELPGVDAVGAASDIPLTGGVSWAPVSIDGYTPPQGDDHEIVSEWRYVSPEYFATMGIPLMRGRSFEDGDRLDRPLVAIIDQHFADTYFPDRDPIGMRVSTWGAEGVMIVGVVGTVKHDALDRVSRVTTYFAQGQVGARGMYLTIKTAGDPQTLAAPVRRAVEELDDNLAVVDVRSMRSRVADSLAERRFSMALLQILSVIALILACVGIYGLVSYRVNDGAHEIGLRMALGAPAPRILRLVLRHGLMLASAGVVTGLAIALAVTRFLRAMLFGVSAVDARTFAAVAAGLVATTLVACYVPARRATLVDPLDAIKAE